jgi:flagellar basal body P-ring protein FlgI
MISPCVVAVSDLTISVVNEQEVSQPLPGWNRGTTEKVGRTHIEVTTNNTEPKPLAGGATISDLLQNLRTLGLTPPQLVAVFQSLDMGGYLHAQLEIR